MRQGPLTRILPGFIVSISFLVGAFQACTSSYRHIDRSPGYPVGFIERGEASWYGPGFHGNKTANGERYDMHKFTAAHRTLPLGSVVVVRSLASGRQATVRINDRGPFAKGRILDLSLAGAKAIGMVGNGTDQIEIRVIDYNPTPEGMGVLRIQVGAFAELHNAQALLAQVRQDLPDGRIVEVDLPEGRRYRVRVGRFVKESDARSAAARLDQKLHLHSFIVRDDG